MVQFIQDTECIGDSLIKINGNFSFLRTNVLSLSSLKFDKTGGAVSGPITLPEDPQNSLHATTKQYVDELKPKARVSFAGAVANGDLCNVWNSQNVTSVRKIGNPGLYKVTFNTPFIYNGSSGACVVRNDFDATGYWVCGSGYKIPSVALAAGYNVENYINNTSIEALDIQTLNFGVNPTGTSYRDVNTLSITFF